MRCSQIVSASKSARSSGNTPILFFTSKGDLRIDVPEMSASPMFGASRPVSILTVVDLPEPLGPRKPKIVPLAICRLRSLTATSRPNFFVKFLVSISNISVLMIG